MLAGASGHAQEVNPYPRERIGSSTLHEWTFDGGREGWSAVHDSRLAVSDGVLSIESTGGDPYVHGPEIEVEAPALLRLRLRCRGAGGGQVFWLTRESPTWKEESSARFELVHDGEWRDYEVPIETSGTLSRIRLDPGLAPGVVEADRIAIEEYRLHPLEIVRVEVGPASDTALVRNHSDRPIGIHMGRCGGTAPAGGIGEVSHVDTSHGSEPFEAVSVQVTAGDLPPLSRTVFLFWPDVESEWLVLESPELLLKLAPDGSGARIERKGKLVAVLAPILRCGDLNFRGVWTKVEDRLDMRNDLATVQISLAGSEIRVSIEARGPVEGPVLRALGPLEQGLFAGIEYLGKGECSSSNLDIETPEHVRFAPDPLDVTMPLMAVATPESWAGMTWDDPSLGPVFASPNFFDGTPDHRMALRGQQIEATIGLGEGTIEEAILWAARRRGLPPLPEAPRDAAAQRALCLSSLEGPLRDERGWGHCAEPNWKRAPYADHASTIWRLTGKAPELASLAPGGSHIINDAIWFVTGRAREWLESRTAGAHAILAGQREDGSFRYSGPYQRGHFEDTASGFCAQKAVVLLEHARATGDPESLEGGLRALEYMKRFRTPRGAQTWELSLHTPDILASAYLVWAYVLGFELAGREEYLDLARRWALSGLPFVYQWSRHPTMAYATVPVFGATNWNAPNWIGLPVQWCGTVYAYSLVQLVPHDDALDWKKLAEGILLAAEQMQYPDGPLAGCLPDVFDLASQARLGPSINPCALASLRLVLAGELDSLAVVTGDGHRVLAPFPVEIRDGRAIVRAPAGATYQVLVDGERVVDVTSTGEDSIPLE